MKLTLGPVLFKWEPETFRDFYFRMADESPVETVVLGETICTKREAFVEPFYPEIIDRLTRAKKEIVFSTLAQVTTPKNRAHVEKACARENFPIEANDPAALWHLDGRAHRLGPFMNVYNEGALDFLHAKGATHLCLNPELPKTAARVLAARAKELGMGTDILGFGRFSLSLSARCYHARAVDRQRDACRFACDADPDGMPLTSLDGETFLTVNGVQVLSHSYLCLLQEIKELQDMGLGAIRLSPHSIDMCAVSQIFRDVIDGKVSPDEGEARLNAMPLKGPLSNGFYHKKPGCQKCAA